MIIDTSAVIAIAFGEPKTIRFVQALRLAQHTAMSYVTLFECSIVLQRRTLSNELLVLDDLLQEFEVELVPVESKLTALAIEAYRQYGKGRHPAGLNFGDCLQSSVASHCSARGMTLHRPIC